MRNIDKITHNGKTVKQILDEHLKWLRGEGGGHIANLSHADLREVDLTGVNLREANLSHADLRGAYLTRVDLRCAYLTRVDLREADLTRADLEGADLRGADLRGTDLRGTDLEGADLRVADLYNVVGKDILVFQFKQHSAYSCDGNIKIGCQEHPIEWWKDYYKMVGAMNNYSDKEIKMYGMFIDMCEVLNEIQNRARS